MHCQECISQLSIKRVFMLYLLNLKLPLLHQSSLYIFSELAIAKMEGGVMYSSTCSVSREVLAQLSSIHLVTGLWHILNNMTHTIPVMQKQTWPDQNLKVKTGGHISQASTLTARCTRQCTLLDKRKLTAGLGQEGRKGWITIGFMFTLISNKCFHSRIPNSYCTSFAYFWLSRGSFKNSKIY